MGVEMIARRDDGQEVELGTRAFLRIRAAILDELEEMLEEKFGVESFDDDVFGEENDEAPGVVGALSVEAQDFRYPLRNLVRRIIRRKRPDSPDEDIEDAIEAAYEVSRVKAAESDRPFLDWLMNGGLEKIIELILKLLPLFLMAA